MTTGSRPVRGQQLTGRELWVLQRLAIGWTYAAVARKLGVSDVRARGIGHEIVTKLGVRNITHAVHFASHTGLIGRYPDCGRRATYQRHIRQGETPCVKCRRAEAALSRKRRKNKISGGDRVQSRDGR